MLKNKWFVLAVISAAIFLVGLDMTVLFTALPTITHELHASSSDKLWIINAFPLVMAGSLLGMGTLGDRIGHRPVFLMGLAVFGVASMVAAFSPSVGMLICGRIMLAIGAAMMLPASLALVRHTFTTDQERGMAIGVWGSMYAGAASVGPLIGGALLNSFPWGSIFLINVPIILLAMLFTPFAVRKTTGNPDQPWHLWSSLVVMTGLVAVTFAVMEATEVNANYLNALIAAIVGLAVLTWFYRQQVRAETPMVDFSLFKNASFSGGILTILVSMIAFIGVQLVMTQQLQLVQGFSPFKAGAYIIPISLASFIAGPIAGSFLHKIGVAKVLWISLLTAALGLVGLAMFGGKSFSLQLLSLVVFGFGAGSGMASSSVAIMLNTPGRKAGMAASMEGVAYEFGGVLGVALMGSIATLSYSMNMELPDGVSGAALAKDSLDQALLLAESLNGDVASQLISSAKAAFSHAYFTVLVACALTLAVMGVGFAINLKDGSGKPIAF